MAHSAMYLCVFGYDIVSLSLVLSYRDTLEFMNAHDPSDVESDFVLPASLWYLGSVRTICGCAFVAFMHHLDVGCILCAFHIFLMLV